MPRQYTPEEKSAALVLLAENRGSIALTAHQLGIPTRTLREWRQQDWLDKVAPPSSPPPPSPPPPTPPAVRQLEELPPFENDLEAVNFMRRQMLDDLVEISRQLRHDFAYATPYQRMVIIPQLLDRLMKLDDRLKPYRPKEEITIELADSEGEEPDDDWDDQLEFLLLGGGNQFGPYSAHDLRDAVEIQSEFGHQPVILVKFWRQVNDDDYKIDWQGTLTLSNEESSHQTG